MTEDNKSSNLILFGLGVVAMFFAYLIYVKSKETTQSSPVLSLHPDNNQQYQYQYQPYQPYQPPLQCPPPQIIQFPHQQSQTQVDLYKISEQLKLQNEQIKSIQEQQAMHTYNINDIENTKCSNVVSMGNNKISNLNIPTNVRRENEEHIANTVFGMK